VGKEREIATMERRSNNGTASLAREKGMEKAKLEPGSEGGTRYFLESGVTKLWHERRAIDDWRNCYECPEDTSMFEGNRAQFFWNWFRHSGSCFALACLEGKMKLVGILPTAESMPGWS
jgi:hypothetical protein